MRISLCSSDQKNNVWSYWLKYNSKNSFIRVRKNTVQGGRSVQETGHAVQVSDSSVQASPWNPACLPMATCLFLKFEPNRPPGVLLNRYNFQDRQWKMNSLSKQHDFGGKNGVSVARFDFSRGTLNEILCKISQFLNFESFCFSLFPKALLKPNKTSMWTSSDP